MFYRSDAQRRAMFANIGNRKNSFSSSDDSSLQMINQGLEKLRTMLKNGDISKKEYDKRMQSIFSTDSELDEQRGGVLRSGIKVKVVGDPSEWIGESSLFNLTGQHSPIEPTILDPSANITYTGTDVYTHDDELRELQKRLMENEASQDTAAEKIKVGEDALKHKNIEAKTAFDAERRKYLESPKAILNEYNLKKLEGQPKVLKAQTREALKLKAIDIGAPYAGMGARVALETGKSAVHAPVHIAGRIVAPPIHGAKRILTAPARVLGSATSGMKGAVGFAGQEAASVLHDFGSAAHIAGKSFGDELARGVTRAFGSGKGFTREMSDPFLRSYHTQTSMLRPIGGFTMPTGIRRFEPSSWGGQLI